MTELCAPLTVMSGAADAQFVPTLPRTASRPVILDADNLADALRQSARLRSDSEHGVPLPLLRIDVAAGAGFGSAAIPFAQTARRVAGLIADAARVGIAYGAVLLGADPDFDSDVAQCLLVAGFRVQRAVPEWSLGDHVLAATS